MIIQNENQILVSLISVLAIHFAQCSEESSSGDVSKPAAATPFKGEIYLTIDDRKVITFMSSDELELTENGVNLICKYTKQTDAIRVVANVAGTVQALYFKITDWGLLANDKTIYLSPKFYASEREKEVKIAEKKVWFETTFL